VDGALFILHLLEVTCLLYHAGARDEVIAGWAFSTTSSRTPTPMLPTSAEMFLIVGNRHLGG
jgi:hypothetical protein